jgi:hypothetical protein
MMKRSAAVAGMATLVIFLTAFAGSALAGNGKGGNTANSLGNAATEPASASPGNSGNAPGHNKDTQSSASANSAATAGMKPTNSTTKDTSCTTGGSGAAVTCAAASSDTAAAQVGTNDASKRYGNGSTAAQIATQNGAAAGTTVFGPGNSQPHKATCPNTTPKNHGGGVDVHALKNHALACSTTSTTTAMTSQNGSTSVTVTVSKGVRAEGKGLTIASASGGVLGATATSGKAASTPAGGVLGALTTVGSGTLPFTGFPLWAAALFAVALIVVGLSLRRFGRAAV